MTIHVEEDPILILKDQGCLAVYKDTGIKTVLCMKVKMKFQRKKTVKTFLQACLV